MPVDAPEQPERGSRWPRQVPWPSIAEIPLLVAFVIAAWRNKWIADDGYIYLTFVERTLGGDGAGFNTGERVEAYTSVGWFVLLTAARFVVRIGSLETLVLVIGLATSTVAVALLVAVERRAAEVRTGVAVVRGWAAPVLNLPLALAAGTYVFTSFATSGLETPLLMLWCSGVALVAWTLDPDPRVLAGLAAAAPLVRPDLGLIAVALAVLAWRSAEPGRRWWVPMAAAAPLAISVAIRIGVYGQLVPNTYYAKTDTGHGWSDGVAYLRDSAMPYALQWLVVLCLAVALARPVQRWMAGQRLRSALDPTVRRSLLLLGAALVTGLQVMTVGGDFMHGRFWIVPWWFLLASLAGAGTAWVRARSGPPVRSLVVSLVIVAVVFGVQSWSTSLQRIHAADEFFGLGDITDEQAFYESNNPEIHALRPDNQSPLFRLGRSLSALSAELDEPLGVTVGAIGQLSYGGASGPGDVFVYDLVGLTRVDVSRLAVTGDTRVGHARSAPDVMAALHPQVDFHTPYFEGYADAFAIDVDGNRLVLVDPDLIDDLLGAGVIDAAAEQRMRSYLDEALHAVVVDANMLTFLRERVHEDVAILARIDELDPIERSSSWRGWLDRTAGQRSDLGADGCADRSWFACVGLAIDRHGAGPIAVDVVEPDLVEVAPAG